MTDAQVQNARRRLALGISNVGFWVLASLAGLLWFSPQQTPPVARDGLFLGLVGAVAVQSLFDLAGGFFLMPPAASGPQPFVRPWLRGVTAHCFLLGVAGGLNYCSFLLTNHFYTGITAAMLGLFLFRRQVLFLASGTRLSRSTFAGASCWSAASRDPSFTGGTAGMGSAAAIVLPEVWRSQLSATQLQTVLHRRLWEIKNNLPARSFASVLFWNLLGCGIGSSALAMSTRTPEHALLLQSCWMTLWSFAGLLLLPSLSRSTVFGADRAAAASGCDAPAWIRKLPEITGEDGNGKQLLQRIFYPIPSTEERLRHLTRPVSHPVLGNVARTNLFLSLATLTFLGRCVHCNAGRPELWIFPPSD
jgi:Zn-dependent protease with chaperone function